MGGGGGGRGGAAGGPLSGSGGGDGAEVGPASNAPGTAGESGAGVAGLLSWADKGLGGAMVPNRMEASCLADPPPTRLSSSSLDSSFSEPAADHSSSSGRLLEPVSAGVSGLDASCWASRANGLVDGKSRGVVAGGESGWLRGTGRGAAGGGPVSEDWDIFLK